VPEWVRNRSSESITILIDFSLDFLIRESVVLDENFLISVACNSSTNGKTALVRTTVYYLFYYSLCRFMLIHDESRCVENNRKMVAEAHIIAI